MHTEHEVRDQADSLNHGGPELNTLRRLSRRPEYALALGTLWLYLVAYAYLDGYVGLYIAKAHWFSPSIFTLVAFSSTPIFYALCSAMVFVLLQELNPGGGKTWWVLFGVWVMAVVGLTIRYQSAAWREYSHVRPDLIYWPLASNVMWAALPLVNRWTIAWVRGRTWNQKEARDPGRSIPIEASEALCAVCLGIVVVYAMHYAGLADARADNDRATTAWQFWNSVESTHATDSGGPDFAHRILFTDGNATLQSYPVGDSLGATYRTNADSPPLLLMTARDMVGRLGQPEVK